MHMIRCCKCSCTWLVKA